VSTEHTITKKAADGSGLTVTDLRDFLAEFDKAASPDPATEALKPKARVGFGGGIKSITVTVPGGSEQR
jgi:hypothetical protein